MRDARKFARSRLAISTLITAAVFAVIAGARSIGSLEELELGTYDWLLRSRPLIQLEDNPVVLIKLREEEVQKYGHPLCDARMAVAIEKLRELGAVGIGIDIYRDNPISTCTGQLGDQGLSETGTDLAEAALRDDRVVWVAKPGDDPPIAPPAFLVGTSQVATSDIPTDASGIVRRTLMYYSYEGADHFSLGFHLAWRYVRGEGIQFINDPDQPDLIRIGERPVPKFQPNDGGNHAENTCWTSRWATTASRLTHSRISTRIRFQQEPCATRSHCWAQTRPP
jgi:CHASE2 domain-containing sensor protein